ncbi:MAG: pantetheine-phosphate adenylyltransferase [Gammaproteobacteria bacterium]|jgi:pantetheine-phosphate adenylyltransferase|uniref:Phosphopantetheine adenylyltransferase n=1 Tax=SAR86 cluster bacterium TaxID=2030880 RepID=A0A368C8I7_9GAMM|nr:MAG: pantetheine-phosphate adenylyltransferase [SAR86 cluster bacterium]RPG41127.1 MAG: pantetheine-phosphate adenylyltransferase [Gammaproteobacteria bacterium TMED186]|tara:strand:- start:4731 stop:5213 length:483 start_codon:yes stop_codon:yes gene_type:complete
MKVAIYPGSFDPITFGHMDIIERACGIFDKVILAVAESETKKPLFTLDERLGLTKSIYSDHPKIETVSFSRKLTVELAREHNACAIIRGLRAVADFEYEFQLATMNRSLAPDIESIFLTPKDTLIYVSSSLVKEIAELKGDISRFVHPNVDQALKAKLLV